jgi:diamine N-acetyltransferase
MNIHYRHATADDIPMIARLGADTFVDTFGHLYSTDDLNSFLHEVHSIQGVTKVFESDTHAYHLAFDNDTAIGYCKIGACELPIAKTLRNYAELKQLYIQKKYFGLGISQYLMNWAMTEIRAREYDDVYLSVWSENLRAQAFYCKYGFAKIGDYKFKVGNQYDHEFIYHHRITPEV